VDAVAVTVRGITGSAARNNDTGFYPQVLSDHILIRDQKRAVRPGSHGRFAFLKAAGDEQRAKSPFRHCQGNNS
jgi:hypothetical protein